MSYYLEDLREREDGSYQGLYSRIRPRLDEGDMEIQLAGGWEVEPLYIDELDFHRLYRALRSAGTALGWY